MKKLIIITILVSFFSCIKDNGVGTIQPNEPKIESLVIELSLAKDQFGNDCVFTYLTFQYIDGYGNFGNLLTSSHSNVNCIVSYSKKIDGVFYCDTIEYINPFHLYIPEAEVGGTTISKPILHKSYSKYQGQVTIDLGYSYPTLCTYICPGDTVKYSVQIMDRDSLFSNIIAKESVVPID